MHVDDMEHDDEDEEDMDEGDDDDNDLEVMAQAAREALRKRPRSYMCEEENMSGAEDDEDDDCDGPENLCMKNDQNSSNNAATRSNSADKESHAKTNNNNNNNNRIGLSLKDIRHLNRPSHGRHGLFPGFPLHHLPSKDEQHIPKADHAHKPNEPRPPLTLQQHGQRYVNHSLVALSLSLSFSFYLCDDSQSKNIANFIQRISKIVSSICTISNKIFHRK